MDLAWPGSAKLRPWKLDSSVRIGSGDPHLTSYIFISAIVDSIAFGFSVDLSLGPSDELDLPLQPASSSPTLPFILHRRTFFDKIHSYSSNLTAVLGLEIFIGLNRGTRIYVKNY